MTLQEWINKTNTVVHPRNTLAEPDSISFPEDMQKLPEMERWMLFHLEDFVFLGVYGGSVWMGRRIERYDYEKERGVTHP